MFGYIMIHKEELKIREYHCYSSYYCGLCRTLGEHCGQLSRLTLTYDMTFVILLLTGLYEPDTTSFKKICLLHPGKRQPFLINSFTSYAADLNLLLSCCHFQDNWIDERKISSFVMSGLLEKSRRRAAKRRPEQAAVITQYMERLAACEHQKEQNLDTAAGYTGEMLGELLAFRHDEWSDSLRRLGFYLGKFIYLCDAWEDLDKDKKSGNYNPLIFYESSPDFETQMYHILTMMAAECASEFEKLPILEHAGILRNILYSGIWTRYRQTEQKRREQNKIL